MQKNGAHAGFITIFLLQLLVLFYSFSTLLSKLAANEKPLSFKFLLLYGGSLLIMGIFALGWQQFLRKVPLTTAYSSKTVAMVWSMLLGAIFLKEQIKWNMIVGTLIIFAGLFLVLRADGEEKDNV